MAIRLVAILVGASYGVTAALAALAVGQLVATAISGTAGTSRPRAGSRGREPTPARCRPPRDRLVRRPVERRHGRHLPAGGADARSCSASSRGRRRSATTASRSHRRAASPPRVRPSGSCSSPSRRATGSTAGERPVLRGVRRYSLAAAAVAAVAVPVFLVTMPWLVRVVFGSAVPPGGRRGAHRPRLRRDPARARLVEVVARDDRPAATYGS